MLKSVRTSLGFMSSKERSSWYFLTSLRSLLSLLDVAGIFLIGFVAASTAVFFTSGSDPDRVLTFANLQVPAINAATLPWAFVGILLLFISKSIFSIVLTKRAAFLVAQVEARAARRIAEISLGGDLSDARKKSSEDLTFAVQVGSPSAFNALLNAVNSLASEGMLFIVICLGFLAIDPLATLGTVIYFGLVSLLIHYFVGSRMGRAAQITADSSVRANTAIMDMVSVYRELLVLGKRDWYFEEIYRARVSASDNSATQHYLSSMPRFIIEGALLVGGAIFIVSLSLTGDIVDSAATIGVFLSGGFRLTAAVLPLQNAFLTLKSVIPSANTAHDILNLNKQELSDDGFLIPSDHPSDNLHDGPIGFRFRDVFFSYPDSESPVLAEMSFEVQPGEQVALLGPSGAGKSTVADLLCRVMTPTKGKIEWTVSGHSDEFKDALGRVSYVPQRPGLVAGTILQNVALGEDKDLVNVELVMEALRLAHLAEVVNSLPNGLESQLGNLKDGLSGGQIQRLGLARALYTRPGLLVMDEATSALDAESEYEIQKALDAMRGKVTVVLIAHRLNTIQHADKVILIEDGHLKDSGTFKELIARNPSVERVVDLMKVEKN
jgi:ATP-binding cassette, subfamily B, bacterial PglK